MGDLNTAQSLPQGDDVVGKVIELGYALERSAFTEFWAQAAACKELLSSGVEGPPMIPIIMSKRTPLQ